MQSPRKALVTGAAGFLGYHLCQKLSESGYEVVGVDDICTGLQSNADDLAKMGVKFIKADVSESWEKWAKDLAGWDPLESTCRHASLSIL